MFETLSNSYIEDNPPWRSKKEENYSSSKLLDEILEKLEEGSTEGNPDFLSHFVHQANIGEDVGTQEEETTKSICESSPPRAPIQRVRETWNTFKALQKLEEIYHEMEETGMITVQQICDTHKILMDGLHDSAGEIRKTVTYTIRPDGEKYYYTPPDRVNDRLYSVIDRHNQHMQEIHNLTLSRKEKLFMTVKAAAWLLLNFVDTHPFADGNGRMSRLLAGYTIMVVNPFPVQPYHADRESYRSDYINAIVYCSRSLDQWPSRIAALLVDGLHNSWSLVKTESHTCTYI